MKNLVMSMAEWLDHLTLLQKGSAPETTSRPVIKCKVKTCQLSVTLGEMAKGITSCGHMNMEGPGLHGMIKPGFNSC